MTYFKKNAVKLKYYIARMLCNNITGKMLEILFKNNIPTFRFGYFNFDFSNKNILPKTKAAIFWGLYETGELRLINKYLRNDFDVIELGASLGVISCHIIRKINTSKRLISVEANPYLIGTIRNNLNNYAKQKIFHVLNVAVGNRNLDKINFYVNEDNVYSQISDQKTKSTVEVKVKSLSEIIFLFSINEYTLVSDIEGAELSFLIDDSIALKNCKQILIELHDTEYGGNKYLISDIRNYIEDKLGFVFRANYGAVFVFEKN